MMKDLILGCFYGYQWETVQYWANSIARCGFTGDRAVMVYDTDEATLERLRALSFDIRHFDPEATSAGYAYPFSYIDNYAHRFQLYYEYLSSIANFDDYRFVVATDVRDVVFQDNPSLWLQQNLRGKQICASSEGLIYRHEPWSNASMQNGYPRLYDRMAARTIWNCGVQAGEIGVMRDFWLQLAMAGAAGHEAADQAAYNILLSLRPWSEMTRFTTAEDGWACQAGTAVEWEGNPFLGHLLEPSPVWDGKFSCTRSGQRHAILHEYDRVPPWTATVQNRYASP